MLPTMDDYMYHNFVISVLAVIPKLFLSKFIFGESIYLLMYHHSSSWGPATASVFGSKKIADIIGASSITLSDVFPQSIFSVLIGLFCAI